MANVLKQQITEDMKIAMKAKEQERLGVIRLILAAIKQREIDGRIELDDVQILSTLDKMIKQRRDSISQYSAAGRQDLADVESKEIDIIQTYLPKPLSATEISALIADAVAASSASSVADMGKIMAILKPKLQGRADIGQVSKLVKDQLS